MPASLLHQLNNLDVLTSADHAMYEAKRYGKGSVHYAVPASA